MFMCVNYLKNNKTVLITGLRQAWFNVINDKLVV